MAKKRGPTPKPDEARSETITFKCRKDYKDWLNEFAEVERDIISRLIDQGLIELAKKKGFRPPPKR